MQEVVRKQLPDDLRLGADHSVEVFHISAPGDKDVSSLITRQRTTVFNCPMKSKPITGFTEETTYVFGNIGELITWIIFPIHDITEARAIRMIQASEEFQGIGCNNLLLPTFELDFPFMLAACSMLRQYSGPMLMVTTNVNAAFVVNNPYIITWKECLKNSDAGIDYVWILLIQRYS
jgi:hypothetical protein